MCVLLPQGRQIRVADKFYTTEGFIQVSGFVLGDNALFSEAESSFRPSDWYKCISVVHMKKSVHCWSVKLELEREIAGGWAAGLTYYSLRQPKEESKAVTAM